MNNAPKISFLVPSISGPVLGPVTVLGKILARHFPVQIMGPDLGGGVCPMYRDAFDYTVVPTPRIYRIPDYFRERQQLAAAIQGDIIIAVKAASTTLPVAFLEKKRRGAKVVAYLDEWDGALWEAIPRAQRFSRWLKHWQHPGDEVYLPRIERSLKLADEVVSTTRFLQHRFGGRVIHMGVDADRFSPSAAPDELRAQLGLMGQKLVVFGGVVRPHKGIELILDALVLLQDPAAKLLVVGPETDHLKMLQATSRYSPYLLTAGSQPASEMPRFLRLADAVVLPLKDDRLAQSQMPCKVFEAMATGCPIVASHVADLPWVLEGCGWIVPPDQSQPIAAALREIFADPAQAKARGLAARERCLTYFSQPRTEEALIQLIQDLC